MSVVCAYGVSFPASLELTVDNIPLRVTFGLLKVSAVMNARHDESMMTFLMLGWCKAASRIAVVPLTAGLTKSASTSSPAPGMGDAMWKT